MTFRFISTGILCGFFVPGLLFSAPAAEDCIQWNKNQSTDVYEIPLQRLKGAEIGFCPKKCHILDWQKRRYRKWNRTPAGVPKWAPASRRTKTRVTSATGGIRLCESDKKCRVLPISLSAEAELAGAEILGDRLLLRYARCAGPCVAGKLYDIRTGRFIADAGGGEEYVIGESLRPQRAGENLFVFVESYGRAVVFQNIRTGRVVKKIDLTLEFKRRGKENYWFEPDNVAVFRAGPGQRLLFFTGNAPGTALLIDTRKRRIEAFMTPNFCPAS